VVYPGASCGVQPSCTACLIEAAEATSSSAATIHKEKIFSKAKQCHPAHSSGHRRFSKEQENNHSSSLFFRYCYQNW
jgi:putative component of membrane protein insertase Oxa1/YidC/SpoIIIJ protein YidD